MSDLLPQRIPEPELMDEPVQAAAYAHADFEQPHSWFVELLLQHFPDPDFAGRVIDLGCGPADISLRVAKAWPHCELLGVDGAEVMLEHGREAIAAAGLQERVALRRSLLPDSGLAAAQYDAVISNSLLHHLHQPQVLWQTIRALAAPGCRVFIMDLMRPASADQAAGLVQVYAGEEPEILRRDFYNSLLAAFRPDEVARQLQEAELGTLTVAAVSDRHLAIHGVVP